ncbi:hypothetical protein CPT03_19965 [Pedobacter ginsengisoli]|uniref:Protein-glutamine gamma-glutamyltransferase-like C-terminal domain-containing protein n=1 Tax=Pedobacter ginsengisoli TaxID=363852 RepID=A0A2D1UAC0_9SPHI|nr:DUF4129 domain-containing protein [Pedobacter ginsengisoli]ATP58578.1 hypothetical protein CPT03_19965 [Pedobacter ginsengisoli]
MRILVFFFLFFGILQVQANVGGRDSIAKKTVVRLDSTNVNLRKFDKSKLDTYSKKTDFIYDDAPAPNLSLWDRFWLWVWDLIGKTLNNKVTGGLVKYLAIVVLVGLVVFLVLKIIGADLKIFSRQSQKVEVPYTESDDNIHEINFNDQIEKAVATANYRLAVRLLYLRTLKKLSDRSLIHWLPEKTNQTYISEINDPDKKKEFSKLTHQFEYVWYGEFFIDKENFYIIKDTFERFNLPGA